MYIPYWLRYGAFVEEVMMQVSSSLETLLKVTNSVGIDAEGIELYGTNLDH